MFLPPVDQALGYREQEYGQIVELTERLARGCRRVLLRFRLPSRLLRL